jgi:hypothetical protein
MVIVLPGICDVRGRTTVPEWSFVSTRTRSDAGLIFDIY